MATEQFPWDRLPPVSRAAATAWGDLARHFQSPTLERIESAAKELLGSHISLSTERVMGPAPHQAGRAIELGFTGGQGAAQIRLLAEPDLVAAASSLLLKRPLPPPLPGAALEPNLSGAWAGILICLARSCGLRVALDVPRLVSPLWLEVHVRTGKQSYWAALQLPLIDYRQNTASPLPTVAPSTWSRSSLPIQLQLIAGLATTSLAELSTLRTGDCLFLDPEAACRITQLAPISGICALGSPDEERGFQLDFASTGLVLGTQTVALALDGSSPMKSESLDTVIQNAPVVVRLELGAVSMTAAEWSRLAPGDVVKSGQPVGSAVNLSVSGVSVARGELVNVDGEIGVRITALSSEPD